MPEPTPELRPKEEGPIIRLPDDPVLKERLEKKLAEYEDRKKKAIAQVDLRALVSATYKFAVLDQLLNDGIVYTWGLARDLEKEFGGDYNVEYFNKACGVIEDYVKTGGQDNIRGTGLPE